MHTYLAILLLSILSISVPVKAITIESEVTDSPHAQIANLNLTQTKERGSGRLDSQTKERGSGRLHSEAKERGSGRVTSKPNHNSTKTRAVVKLGQKQCERGSGRCNAEV